MHHALQIQEILLNIFYHCRFPYTRKTTADLLALATTCRAFKEPALDMLWGELLDPSPIAQCLPEASQYRETSSPEEKCYSFCRRLTQIEWDTLQGYTRRIRSILDYGRGLDWESVTTFLNPPPTEPLFPNLCDLHCDSEIDAKHLLFMPFPSLISLSLEFIDKEKLDVLQGSLESFSKFSPNIRKLGIQMHQPDITFDRFLSSCVCRWRNLRTVNCADVTFDADALTHLSRIPALTHLTFMLSATLLDQITFSDSPLFFPNLHDLTLYSELLDPISRLLSRTRLPAITDFAAFIECCPSKSDVFSFLANVRTSGISRTIRGLRLDQGTPSDDMDLAGDPRPVLEFEDLQPCMAFRNLCRLNLNIEWNVELMDSKLLTLASAWPHLEHLVINEDWGWKTLGGITPSGLVQLLQTCRSLSSIALAIDTRGYTKPPQSPTSLGLSLPPTFCLDVVDSVIKRKSVPAIAAFLASIAPCSNFSFRAWLGCFMEEPNYMELWDDAYDEVNNTLRQRLLIPRPTPVTRYSLLAAELGYMDRSSLQ